MNIFGFIIGFGIGIAADNIVIALVLGSALGYLFKR